MACFEDCAEMIEWQYDAGRDPWSGNPGDSEWVSYDDITNEMIEEAFQDKKDMISINAYYIKCTANQIIQVNKADKSRQRPVRRRQIGVDTPPSKRQTRFSEVEKPAAKSISNSSVCMSPFVNEWIRKNPNYKFREDTIEKLAVGLLREGELLGMFDHANFLANRLRKNKGASHDEIAKYCVRLYTKESWLYKHVNRVLREGDMSKVDSLGPFCCFVRSYLYSPQNKRLGEIVVYRVMELSAEDIEMYKKSIGEVKSWLAFSSTSRNKKAIKSFKGNTLFVIEFEGDLSQRYPGRDISDLSKYPAEEEVLLYPGADFRVENVEENVGSENRTVIHLSLT
ncbi:unnamed protein product [Adineta steineri]|uniref:WWE domain-containing protein n=1 Tax=Adineta steineri TaxID=433720 RepID=A0A814FYF7_9BILA|nr:unnamed protein product [Adineta steineri]CAF0990228.1 unnamed protein product [Adineta steineri]